ncbi:MAG: helix-turn-helix transcriptional regulator [Ginsengibacter sp.]
MYSLSFEHNHQSSSLLTRAGGLQKINKASFAKTNIAPGVFKTFGLKNGIQCLCSEYKAQEDLYWHKMPSSHKFFILRIDEVLHSSNTILMVDRKYITERYTKSHSAFLLSSSDEFTFCASKNSKVKTLEILIPQKWFCSQLKIECSFELLKRYMRIKTRKAQIDCSNHLFKNLFLKIVSVAEGEVSDIDLEKKVNLLLTIIFSDVTSNLYDFIESEKVKISKDEISRLINVKKQLDSDSPPPTFTSLTKIALMSGTSLKMKFKKMYGTTVFEYFQRIRMQKARVLLLTHKYSVNQIGRQFGYSNLSNFAIAFKKEFNQLPHELIK